MRRLKPGALYWGLVVAQRLKPLLKALIPRCLRGLARQAKEIMIADGGALSIKDNWRQPVSVIEPIYSATKGRRAGVSREDLGRCFTN